MKELCVFVDEAGVFGPFDYRNPYYFFSFVFHDQDDDLSKEMTYFQENINKLGFDIKSLHAGPIIRREEDYKNVDRKLRQRIFKSMMLFFRRTPLKCKLISLFWTKICQRKGALLYN